MCICVSVPAGACVFTYVGFLCFICRLWPGPLPRSTESVSDGRMLCVMGKGVISNGKLVLAF